MLLIILTDQTYCIQESAHVASPYTLCDTILIHLYIVYEYQHCKQSVVLTENTGKLRCYMLQTICKKQSFRYCTTCNVTYVQCNFCYPVLLSTFGDKIVSAIIQSIHSVSVMCYIILGEYFFS